MSNFSTNCIRSSSDRWGRYEGRQQQSSAMERSSRHNPPRLQNNSNQLTWVPNYQEKFHLPNRLQLPAPALWLRSYPAQNQFTLFNSFLGGKKKVTASVGSAEVEPGDMRPKLHTAQVPPADGAVWKEQEEGPAAPPAARSSALCGPLPLGSTAAAGQSSVQC